MPSTSPLCDLGEVTQVFGASIFSAINRGNKDSFARRFKDLKRTLKMQGVYEAAVTDTADWAASATDMDFLTVLEAGSSRSRCQQGLLSRPPLCAHLALPQCVPGT